MRQPEFTQGVREKGFFFVLPGFDTQATWLLADKSALPVLERLLLEKSSNSNLTFLPSKKVFFTRSKGTHSKRKIIIYERSTLS